jgi:hypothetical protein
LAAAVDERGGVPERHTRRRGKTTRVTEGNCLCGLTDCGPTLCLNRRLCRARSTCR